MDTFDIKILNLMQANCRITAEKISEKVGLSPTACQKRLKNLRNNGTIKQDISIVNKSAVGQYITMIVEVTLERKQHHILREFKETMLKISEVMQCYYIMGPADFILILAVKNTQEYQELSKRLFLHNVHIKSYRTNVVMEDVKIGLHVHLKEVA